jgi:hypothetical protein
MVRETSDRPLKLKRAGGGTQLWRIATDASTKSFRLEKQGQAEKWSPAAAFLVAAGACKPTPPKEVPEPTTDAPAEPSVDVLVVPTPGRRPPTLQKKP